MKLVRTKLAIAITAASLLVVGIVRTAAPADAFAATSKATVLNSLQSISGSSIVSGQQNKEQASKPTQ